MSVKRLCDILITLTIAGFMYSGCLGDAALAQNIQCPDRPLGDRTNACANTRFAGTAVASSIPWVNAKSGDNGCAAAKGDGSTDDTAAIQCQLNFIHNTLGAGVLFFPIGNYITSSTLTVFTHTIIQGAQAGLAGSLINSSGVDITALSYADSIGVGGDNSGLVNIEVICKLNASATQNCVKIGNNALVNMDTVVIQGGLYAIDNQGTDGVWVNVNACGFGTHGGCLLQEGGNWMFHMKFDTGGVVDYSINITTGLSSSESSCIACDTSGPFAIAAININSSSQFMSYVGGVIGAPIIITAGNLMISSAEIGTTSVSNAGTLTIANSIATSGPFTVSGVGTSYCTSQGITCTTALIARTLSLTASTSNAFLTGNSAGNINSVAITGLVLGNGASAPTAYAGTSCTNQFPRSLNASGVATCASVANTDLVNSSITIGTTSVALGGSSTSFAGLTALTGAGLTVTGNTTAGGVLTLQSTNNGSPSADRIDLKTGSTTFASFCSTGTGVFGFVIGTPLPSCAGQITMRVLNNTGNPIMQYAFDAGLGMALQQVSSGGTFLFNLQANAALQFDTNNNGSNLLQLSSTGGVSVGTTTDPGNNNFLAQGTIKSNSTTASTSSTTGGIIGGGGLGIAGAGWFGTYINVTPTVVNSLPSCVAGIDGARAYVTNNNTAVAFGGAVTTGGTTHSPVYCDGAATAWKQG